MKEKRILIVTGPIQTGKTTRLFKFVNDLKSVDGILAPIVEGKRHLFHISTRTLKILEAPESSETISIGKYHFLKSTFDWANEKLIKSLNKVPEYLVIDELGKLELNGKGLHKSAIYMLRHSQKYSTKVVFVVRDYLLKQMIDFYRISAEEYEIMDV